MIKIITLFCWLFIARKFSFSLSSRVESIQHFLIHQFSISAKIRNYPTDTCVMERKHRVSDLFSH